MKLGLLNIHNMMARLLVLLSITVLASCGGGGGSPSVALGNMANVQVAMHMQGQSTAGRAGIAAILLPGVQSVTITISGAGFTTIVDSFNATPGLAVTRSFQIPVGAAATFNVQGFNTLVGVPSAAVISGSVTQTLVQSAAPVVVNIPLVQTGQLQGVVKDASNNTALAGATVEVRAGANARLTAPIVATAISSATGNYLFNSLNIGTYTITVSKTGFVASSITATVSSGLTTTVNPIFMSPVLAVGQTRIVLSWGATPTDLDAHLVGPVVAATGSQQFHVFFGAPGSQVASPFAQLNVDVTNGFGPETITLAQAAAGTYSYYAHDFSNGDNATSTVLTGISNATVQVFQGATLVATFNVPVTGAGDVWHVFDMDGQSGTITPVNQIALARNIPALVGVTPTAGAVVAANPVQPVLPANPTASQKLAAFAANSPASGRVRPAVVGVGNTQQVTASVSSVRGSVIAFSGSFSSSNLAVATVSATGLVTGVGVGVANITAVEANLGYSAISAFTVTADVTPPVVIPPANVTLEATGPTTVVTLGTASVTDNVSTGLVASPSFTGPFPVGATTVTWSATDAAGNVGTATQTVTITDTTPPVVTPPAAITISSPTGVAIPLANAAVQAFLVAATANDLVNGAIVPTNNAPASFPVGVTTVVFSATDGVNAASASSTITVIDAVAPTVVSQNPLGGATGVSVDSPVSVIFSEAMNTATINAGSFNMTVTAGQTVIGTISFNAAGTIATLVPTGNLLPLTNYTVSVITTGMTDVAGNAIVAAQPALSFTTGASVVTLPPVLPVLQGPVTTLPTYEGFDMIWSGLANGANALDRWRTTVTNPTTTITGLASFTDGTAGAVPANFTLTTKIAANGIIQFTDTVAPFSETAAASTLDGQLSAFVGFIINLNAVDQGVSVQKRVPNHTAATAAGVFNVIQLIRTPGALSNGTATSNGVLTINANGSWSFAASGSSINPATFQLNAPFTIADNGTFTIDANGAGIMTSAVNVNTIGQMLESADGNYVVGFTMDTALRQSTLMIGVRQHTTTVAVANSTLTNVRVGLSELAPTTSVVGEVGILTVDANGLLNDTHGSRIDNTVICGVPGNANCQFQVSPATTITAGANGTISGVDSTGATFTAIASQNGNVILSEDKGRAIDILFKQ